MFCEDGRVGHRSGLGFHHSGMKHGIHGCCYSNMIHGMHGCCGERKREYYKDMAFIILV